MKLEGKGERARLKVLRLSFVEEFSHTGEEIQKPIPKQKSDGRFQKVILKAKL